jgi:hypothetical protein
MAPPDALARFEVIEHRHGLRPCGRLSSTIRALLEVLLQEVQRLLRRSCAA